MCTGIRFTDGKRNMYFGRNLDWVQLYGGHVVVTPKGHMTPYAFIDDAPAKHRIVGMATVYEGLPLYFDCGNDAGLAVAGLNFPGYAKYEDDAIEGKTNIAAYEFPLWIAANFETVDQVEQKLDDVAIVGKPVSAALGVGMLHWIVGDAERSIVIEYTESGMHIYHDSVDTLTNQPTFDWHMENLRNYLTATGDMPSSAKWDTAILHPYGAGAGMRGIPGDPYSTSRFVRAAFINAHYPEKNNEAENVSRMFHTLGGVSMIDGTAQTASGEFERTLYTSCFSAKTNTYYYNTYDDSALRSVCLDDFANADTDKVIEPEPKRI